MSKKPSPPPKVPQPERLDQVYEALRKGLQAYLSVNHRDLNNLNNHIQESKRNSRLGFLYEFDKQVKVIEANTQRLEILQNKTKGLYNGYCHQKKLRDEASKVMKTCKASSGNKEAKESFAKAQKDYKEYTEKMCALESAIQKQLGQFHIQMKGLAGFARLCAGDQYEICMKYGRQRWKMRGSIEINAKQEWDSEKTVLFPFINEFLLVKVTELKSLTNHVVVGNIVCETTDLFAPVPQMVAVDINELGTIKLVLEVTWYPTPKDDSESLIDSEIIYSPSPPHSLHSTPLDTPTLAPKNLEHEVSWSKGSSDSFPSPPPTVSEKESAYELIDRPSEGARCLSTGSYCLPEEVDDISSETGSMMCSGLEDRLKILISALDEYREQFPDLQILEDELRRLQDILKVCRHRQSSKSSHSEQSALRSFDFLSASDSEDEWGDMSSRMSRNKRPPTERGRHSTFFSDSPLTTGSRALDCSLIVHMNNCRAQMEHLGVMGPLRCRETYALDKLLREARVFKIIRRIVEDNPQHFRKPTEVIPELDLCQDAVSLWQQCVGNDSVYCVPADNLLMTLSTAYSSMLCERTDTVLSSLVERILEQKLSPQSDRDDLLVTLFQLWNYVESNGITDMEMHIIELAEEVWLLENLSTWDQDLIIETLRSPAECSLKREGIQAVAKLLADPRDKVSASASSVLRILAVDPRQREQALVNCMEMLEEDDVNTRVCGCKALACLKAKESVDQLLYLCQVDEDEVQDAATQTLQELGEEGEEAFRHMEIREGSSPDSFEQWSAQPSSSRQEDIFF